MLLTSVQPIAAGLGKPTDTQLPEANKPTMTYQDFLSLYNVEHWQKVAEACGMDRDEIVEKHDFKNGDELLEWIKENCGYSAPDAPEFYDTPSLKKVYREFCRLNGTETPYECAKRFAEERGNYPEGTWKGEPETPTN